MLDCAHPIPVTYCLNVVMLCVWLFHQYIPYNYAKLIKCLTLYCFKHHLVYCLSLIYEEVIEPLAKNVMLGEKAKKRDSLEHLQN